MTPKTRPLWRQNSTPPPMPSAPLSTSLLTSSSSCSKLISLSDWWLVKSETDVDGKRLAVGGYHYSCEEKTMHIFTSAPVVKTFDPYTIETADGSTLRLQGGINRSRMQQNGFPPEVSRCFFIGFPYNWEYYAKKDFGHIIPNSTTLPTSSVINNEGVFPVPAAFESPFVKLLNDCASNSESSLDNMLLKNLTSSPVNAESHDTLYVNKDRVQSETICASEKGNDDVERCTQQRNTDTGGYPSSGVIPMHGGACCEHLPSSLSNVKCDNQNESWEMLPVESLSNKGEENNNEKLSFKKTMDSISYTDAFSIALSPEDLKILYSQQKDRSANKDPEFITRKRSSTLEALFASPQRNTDTESYSISEDKFCSSLSSPFASSLLKQMMRRKRRGSELNLQSHSKRVRVNPSNDDSDVLDSTFTENTDILPLSGKENTENDTKTSSVDASPVRKGNSVCYMLRSRDAKMESNSPNCEKKSKSKPLNLSKLDNKESQNATCVDNLNQNMGSNSSHDTGVSTNLTDNCEGGQILESAMEVEFEGTYIADDTNKHVNDIGNIKHCINKMNAIDEDVFITQTKDFSECSSDYSEIPSGAWIVNRDDANGAVKSEKKRGITNNQDENLAEVFQKSKISKLKKARNHVRFQSPNISEENQAEVFQESKVSKLKKARNQVRVHSPNISKENQAEVFQESKVSKLKKARNQVKVQIPNISEEMKSPLTSGKIGKQKASFSTSPELLNPKRSRSGRLLLPPINRWQREIVYDMDGSITDIADVDKLTSVTGGRANQSRRRK